MKEQRFPLISMGIGMDIAEDCNGISRYISEAGSYISG
jgi:hypothetical protein